MKIHKMISYAKVQEKYGGEYIARRDDKVLVHAKTYPLLVKRLTKEKLDRSKLTIGMVPPKTKI